MAQSYQIAESSTISFSNSDVSGDFDSFSGTIVFNESNLSSSKMSFKIKAESINTGNGMMNKHAKSADWFDAEKYPNIEFSSTRFEKTDAGYKIYGKLEMHGVTKEVSIPFTFSKKGNKATIIAKFSVDRTDYQIGKKDKDVAANLKINATINLTKK
ncbi:MAG: hypothetical protein RLZZ301_1074 [Bacteroidota bacterium]